jgi:hypothetical protein
MSYIALKPRFIIIIYILNMGHTSSLPKKTRFINDTPWTCGDISYHLYYTNSVDSDGARFRAWERQVIPFSHLKRGHSRSFPIIPYGSTVAHCFDFQLLAPYGFTVDVERQSAREVYKNIKTPENRLTVSSNPFYGKIAAKLCRIEAIAQVGIQSREHIARVLACLSHLFINFDTRVMAVPSPSPSPSRSAESAIEEAKAPIETKAMVEFANVLKDETPVLTKALKTLSSSSSSSSSVTGATTTTYSEAALAIAAAGDCVKPLTMIRCVLKTASAFLAAANIILGVVDLLSSDAATSAITTQEVREIVSQEMKTAFTEAKFEDLRTATLGASQAFAHALRHAHSRIGVHLEALQRASSLAFDASRFCHSDRKFPPQYEWWRSIIYLEMTTLFLMANLSMFIVIQSHAAIWRLYVTKLSRLVKNPSDLFFIRST